MTPRIRVTENNRAAFQRTVAQMRNARVLVGIPEDAAGRGDGEPVTNAEIGYVNEFGSPARNIPPRPFLRPGVTEALPQATDALRQAAEQAFDDPGAIDTGLTRAGLIAVSAVKRTITQGVGFAPLSERTLADRRERGFAGEKPLIETGSLLNSITFSVRRGNDA